MDLISVPTLVIAGLVLLWGWVLLRPSLQNLMNGARRDPVGHFNKSLSVLGQAPERSRTMSTGSWQYQSVHKRRQQLLMGIMGAVAVSLLLAVVFRGIFIWQHLLLDAVLAGYLVLASRAGANETMRLQKVTYLGTTDQTTVGGYQQAAGDY